MVKLQIRMTNLEELSTLLDYRLPVIFSEPIKREYVGERNHTINPKLPSYSTENSYDETNAGYEGKYFISAFIK